MSLNMSLNMRSAVMTAFIAALFAGGVFVSAPAAAQDKKAQESAAAEPDPVVEALRTDNPHIKIIEDKARALVVPLAQSQMESLFALREGYGLIRSVEIVRRDIGRAARLCGQDNEDLKKPMAERFKAWDAAVTPVLDERMKVLQTAIDQQNFASASRIRDYFKSLDDAAAYAERKFDKRVVTTPEACKALLESMDDSQESVAAIMADLKVPDFGGAAKAEPEKAKPAKEKDAQDKGKKESAL